MKKIIIYGAGNKGKSIYEFLQNKGKEEIIEAFCDKNADKIKSIPVSTDNSIDVLTLEEALKRKCVFFVALRYDTRADVIKILKEKSVQFMTNIEDLFEYCQIEVERVELNREYCAEFHDKNMETYYEGAEKSLDVFWGQDSVFYSYFSKLDLENIVELACGRGRHIQKYVDDAKNVTVVDILQKNIDFCKERYKGKDNIQYYKNNGQDLKELQSESYTAIFSYDAMVHFEMIDIFSYLKEFYRILNRGGMVLAHHSNNTSSYKVSFVDGVGGRSYMSAELFAHLADRAGFQVVEQKVIDWNEKNLDCITLLRK